MVTPAFTHRQQSGRGNRVRTERASTMSAPVLEDPPASQNRRLKADDPTVIILSSSLLTDRMFRYSGFSDVLAANSKTHLWATSVRNPENQDWCAESALKVEPF